MPLYRVSKNGAVISIVGGSETIAFFAELSGGLVGPISFVAQGLGRSNGEHEFWIRERLSVGDELVIGVLDEGEDVARNRAAENFAPQISNRESLTLSLTLNGNRKGQLSASENDSVGVNLSWKEGDSATLVSLSSSGRDQSGKSVEYELFVGDTVAIRASN